MTWAKVGDICRLVNGKAFKPSDWGSSGAPIIRIQNLNDVAKPFNYWDGALDRQVKVQTGDVLLAWSGTPGTSFGVHIWNRGSGILNQHIFRVDLDQTKITRRWFMHAVNGQLNKLIAQAHGGVGLQHVTRPMVDGLEIPLPPLDEQRRIAAILDKADALRRKRKRALDLLDGLTQSVFLEMFGSPESNPKGWKWGRISDLLEGTQYGTSDKAGEKGKYPILRMGNITNDGRMNFEDLKYIDLDDKDLDKFTVRRGDILFNRTNSAELVGKTAVFDRDEPFAFAGYLVRARVRNGVSPHYISSYLNSKHGKATLRGMAKSIVGMANINAKEMQSMPILMPDTQTQRAYSGALSSIEGARTVSQRHLQLIESTFSSLQSRAFSGQL